MKAVKKMIAFALTVCLIGTQIGAQSFTVMAKEPTQTNYQIEKSLTGLALQDLGLNQTKKDASLLLANGNNQFNYETTTDSAINQNM